MNIIFNLSNSPYFFGSLLILLLIVLILRNPIKSFFKFLVKKTKSFIKKRKNKKVNKKEVKKKKYEFIPKEVVKVVKIEPTKKNSVYVYWQRVLFLILGIGVILNAYIKNWNYFIIKYTAFYNFILTGTNHKNLTTIIISLIISFILLLIVKLIMLLEDKKHIIYRGIKYILFSVIVAVSLILIINVVTNLSLINSIIMGIIFILFGLFIKRRK